VSVQSLLSNAVSDGELAECQIPKWKEVTQLVRVPAGQDRNPVYQWHNDFVTVRQSGRAHMQVCHYPGSPCCT
jgi:hypothetical protein